MNTLDNFRALWESYLILPDESTKRDILVSLEAIRERVPLSEEEWSDFTLTLPGFDAWWRRVRMEFLDKIGQIIDDE